MKTKLLLFVFLNLPFLLLAQWESLGDNIIPINDRVWSIKVAPDRSVWATSTFDAFPPTNQFPRIHRSADEGITWIQSQIPFTATSVGWDISPIDSMNAFIAIDTAGLYQTNNGGLSWNKITSYPFRAYYVHFFDQNDGWVVGADTTAAARLVMSLTQDGGETWINTGNGNGIGIAPGTSFPLNTNDFFSFTYSLNSSYDVVDNTIIMGRSAGNYWRSDDRGYNWTNHVTPLFDSGIMTSNVAMKDTSTFIVAGDILAATFSGTTGVNYTTTDGGLTWIGGSSSMTAAATRYIPGSDSVFVMVGHNNFGWGNEGTAISYDYGKNWERIDNTSIIAIDFLDENTAYGSCCNNFWATANGQIHKWNFDFLSSSINILKPELIGIMPNPATENLTIKTNNVFQTNTLNIEIISLAGQILAHGKYPNTEMIDISIHNLPKGFYSLRITGNQKSVVKKFVKE